MTLRKAREAFQENGRDYLTAKDGHVWNTNAGLLNLVEGLEQELAALHSRIARLEALIKQQ